MLLPTFTLLLAVGFTLAHPNIKAQGDDDLIEVAEIPLCVLEPNAPNCEKRSIKLSPGCFHNFDPSCYHKRDEAMAKRVSDYCKLHACITQKKRGATEEDINYNFLEYCSLYPYDTACPLIVKKSAGNNNDLVTRANIPLCVLVPNSPSCAKRLLLFNPNCLNNYLDPYCPIDFKKDLAMAKRVSDYCKLHACITQKKRDLSQERFSYFFIQHCANNPDDPQCPAMKIRAVDKRLINTWESCMFNPSRPECYIIKKREIMSSLCQIVPDDPDCKNWKKRDTREIMASLCQAFPDDPACKDWGKRDTREIMSSLCQAIPDDPDCKNWGKRDTREIMASLCQAFPDDPACSKKRDDSWMYWEMMCKENPFDDHCLNKWWIKRGNREIMASLCQAFPDDPACKGKRDDSWMYWEMVCEENPYDYHCLNKWW